MHVVRMRVVQKPDNIMIYKCTPNVYDCCSRLSCTRGAYSICTPLHYILIRWFKPIKPH